MSAAGTLAQVRLRSTPWTADTRDPEDGWQTVAGFAPDSKGAEAWRAQVGPVWRRRGYETRVVSA